MSNRTPPAQYDSPCKAVLAHAFHAFMNFYFAELGAQIDWSIRPRFRDKELTQIGFGGNAAEVVADKLVEVTLLGGEAQWILIHIEVQAQHDASLGWRVMDYNYRIFNEYRRPVASLVVLADDAPAWRPNAFRNEVLGTVMGITFATAKLLDYAEQEAMLKASRNPFAFVTLAHLRTQKARHDPEQLYAAKWQLTKLLYQRGWSKRRIIVLFKVINWMMALPEPQQARYWRAIVRLERERKVEWISPLEQSFIDKGRKEGWREGLQEGRQEGAAELLEKLLVRRFGSVPASLRKRLAGASEEQLAAWGAAVLEAPSLKQVFN